MPTAFPGFPPEMITFFRSLKRNNRREWFQPRKHLFDKYAKEPMTELVTALNAQLLKFAPEFVTDPKKALFRIYRDTRFSADKTPYKTHMAASFSRRGDQNMGGGGFYFSVSAEEVEIAAGIYHPLPDTMLLVRNHIANHYQELQKILANKKARKLLGDLKGDQLTRAPKGFDPAHPAIHLIKMKDWFVDTRLDPGIAISPQLFSEVLERFRAALPLITYLNGAVSARKAPAKELFEAHF